MEIPEIDAGTLADKHADGAVILDVRQPHEYEEAHVPGAVLVPLDELPERVAEVPTGEPLYVICERGGRSAKAVEYLRPQGFDAVNVAGGTSAWIEAGHDTVAGNEPG